jgi:uncharacterized protein (DUF433 family)
MESVKNANARLEPRIFWALEELNMENNLLQRITHNPDICHGKPCIRGLRYPVEFILELLSSGMTTEEILKDYDDLELDDILASLLFAARLSQVKSIHKLAS